ncbi:HAMP domain-containing sensor histidine kinase [Flavobacterium sp. DGU11]|uniref:histidine kinase n=1 Tax=Flavobacterium arundinis TaxID=3139143 RepID=A0ABU9I0N9_9FLAO
MKRSILWVFILMSLCVAGITVFQLYYSYKSYAVESAAFERNINEALNQAVDSTFKDRHNQVLKKLRGWLNDPEFITISCKWNEVQHLTVFNIKQVVPSADGQNDISMSIDYFTERADSLTPKARKIFIDHMIDYVGTELKKGFVWYYTQKLGDSINKAAFSEPQDINQIRRRYKQTLHTRGIDLPFLFDRNKLPENSITTKKVNIAVGRPQKEEWLQATFIDTNAFLMKQMRRLLAGSVGLFVILLLCFWYTAKTLLSQHKLNKMKDDFISNMTHEIHTPLSSILVTAEALKKFRHDEEAQQSYIDIILHQGQKLSALTEEILAGAKMEKAGMPLGDIIEVNAFIKNIIDNGHYKNIEYSGSGQSVSLKVNALHLANAVANLIDNAIKYNTADEPLVTIACTVSNKEVVISVTDNGPGIPDSEKERIFGQFYRIPSGNVHNIKGYGLGLSYVRKVVAAHKGVISVKDNVSSGSIFTIKLPL